MVVTYIMRVQQDKDFIVCIKETYILEELERRLNDIEEVLKIIKERLEVLENDR